MKPRRAFAILMVWAMLPMSLLYIGMAGNTNGQAIMAMGLGLFVLWVIVIGGMMYRMRDVFAHRFFENNRYPKSTFLLLAVLFALLEESVAVTMTNLAPFFGGSVGGAYITASGNFIDVVTHHSVIVFIPMFMTWAWLLSKYRFSDSAAFVCFGITGILAEVSFGGPMQFINGGFWIMVYGLMIYLPSRGLVSAQKGDREELHWYHYGVAILLPFIMAIPWSIIINVILFPGHPAIHFPPVT